MSCIGPVQHIVVELMPRKPRESQGLPATLVCSGVVKGFVFAGGALLRGREAVPGCQVDRGITKTYKMLTGITGLRKVKQTFY